MEKRIFRSLTIDSTSDSPARIYSCLTLFAKHFRQGWQEDAHEFLRYVIEACNSVCVKLHKLLSVTKLRTRQDSQKKSKEEPRTVVKDIFGGVLQSQVKCLSCGVESNKLDDIMDLSLDVFKITSVKEAMCRYFQPEVLDGSNKYKCEKCKKLTAARKQMSVFQAPNVLVIQLKRFENIHGGKVDRHISFDERLELHGHMCRGSQDQRPEYLLYAVIVHAGYSQDSGHYYSYVKDTNGKWFCCNDAHVTSVSAKSVLAEKAYILFYVRHASKSTVKSSEGSQNGHVMSSFAIQTKLPAVESHESSAKENGSVANVSTCSADKGQGVQQVRFNIMKPGPHGQSRKLPNSDNGRAGKSSMDSGQAKRPLGAKHVSSNGNSDYPGDFSVSKNDETDLQKQGHPDQKHCGFPGKTEQTTTAHESNHHKPEILDGTKRLTQESENGGHNLRGLFPGKMNGVGVEPDSNCQLGGFECAEKAASSYSGALQQQQASVQLSHGDVGAYPDTDGCGKVNKTETRTQECEALRQTCGGIKRKMSNGSIVNPQYREDNHSQESAGGAMAIEKSPSERLPVEGPDVQSLKLWLATDSREWLLRSGWCDTVRNSFRLLKKARLVQEIESRNGRKETLRMDVFTSVHDSLRQKVPKELKEHLVQQLQAHFAAQRVKEK